MMKHWKSWKMLLKSVKEFDEDALVVASGYADAHRVGA